MREWILQSAEQWVRDFHVDGLRLDAIHALVDSNPEHIVAAIARRVHTVDPRALVIAESGLNDPKVMRPRDRGGWGCDAAWADDFHHALRVALTGETDGWYEEFEDLGTLAKAFHRPHVHDGTYSTLPRAAASARPADDVPPERFVVFASNHDQVGNRAFGDRPPVEARPLAALLTCLVPVHADALPGRGVRRARAVPVLLRPHRRGDRHGDARGAPERVRGLRVVRRARSPTRRTRRPSRRSKLTREGEPDGPARRSSPTTLRPARRARRRTPRPRRRSTAGA